MQPRRLVDAWIDAERGRFVLWLPVLQAAGAALYFSLRREPPWWSGAAVLALALAGWWVLRARMIARAPCAGLAALALGAALAQWATARAPPLVELPRRASIVTGTVSAVDALADKRRVTIAAPSLDGARPLPRSLRITLHRGDDQPLATGDRVRIRALLMPPPPPAWPGGWDLQRAVFYGGLGGYGYALNPVRRVTAGAPGGLGGWMQRAREAIAARIGAALGPGSSEAGLATALLTGATHGIHPADRAAFQAAGLAHLLAISGLHIAIVMGLFFTLTRFVLVRFEYVALRWPTRQLAALAALAAGAGYTLLTGAQVPMLRSFAMACLVTLGLLVGRRALSLRGLALALALVLAWLPVAVMGASLQMSFAAVLALVAGYDALRPWLAGFRRGGGRGRRVLAQVMALVLTSALAGIATAPFVAYHFGRVQLWFIAANLAAVPLTGLWVMPAGVAALALMPFHLEALALAPMGWGIDALLWIARTVASWPGAVLAVPHMPGWGLAVLCGGLAWLGLWRSRLRLAGVAALALALLSPALWRAPDLLVSPDARLIGLRTGGGVLLARHAGGSAFVEQAWLRLWAVRAARPFPGCDGAWCMIRRHPEVMLVRGQAPRSACAAALVVSAEPVDLRCPVMVIDRFTVYRGGAQAVWFEPGGLRVLSDRENRGERPWVIPVPTRSAMPRGVALTPAQTERLPPE